MSEVTGRIKMIDETKAFGSNGFRKREMVVTTDTQYPQHIMIEFTQDKCDLLNNYNVGDAVKVSYNLNGREWVNPQGETKYFNSIQGWRIEKENNTSPPHNTGVGDRFTPATNFKEEEHDDLPF